MTAPYSSDVGNAPGNGPLRYGGVSVTGLPVESADMPDKPSKAVERQAPALAMVRDLASGAGRVKAARELYLPKAPGESPANYSVRLARSVFFNFFGKAIEGLTGFVFAKDPVLGDDVPPVLREHWENIDLAGTHGDVFARDLLQDDLTAGHAAIHVEYPKTGGTQNAAAELGANAIRPYWIPIKKDNIVSWRTTVEQGRLILTQLVLKECTQVAVGSFGEKEQTRYRVLYRHEGVVGFVVLGITEKKEVIVMDEGLYPTQDEIPVSEIITSGRVSLFESDPPLYDLGCLNTAHYQMWSDYAYSLHKTCVPILVLRGMDPQGEGQPAIVVGPNAAITFTNPDGGAEYVSHDGAALGACKQALDDLKADMATLSLAMLAPDKRAAETAEAKRIDKAASDSALGVTARGLQDGIERAMGFHAKYMNLPTGGSITINRDFENEQMDATTMVAYANLASTVGLPLRVILEELQKGGRISDAENLDDLEAEMVAQKAAADAQAAAEAASQLEAMQAGQQTPAKAAA